jgi:hypothetical protein
MAGLYFTEAELRQMLKQNPALRLNQKFSQTLFPDPGRPARGEKIKSGAAVQGPLPLEEEEQERLAEKLDELGVDWFHPPNGGFRKITTAKRLRKLGVKPGVPDIVIITPPPAFPGRPGTVIELKRLDGGDVSDYQIDWLKRYMRYGWVTAICPGYVAAVEVLKICGYMEVRT